MIKYVLIILFITFGRIDLAKSQNASLHLPTFEAQYKAVYSASFQRDSTDAQSKETGIQFTLYLSNQYSYFVNNERHIRDSILFGIETGEIDAGFYFANPNARPKAKANSRIVKDKINNRITVLDNVAVNEYAYHEPMDKMKWIIEQETQKIGNLQCQKARGSFAGRDYIAWFTRQIALPEGPYKFNGLPGLIVKIEDTQQHYIFELVDFKEIRQEVFLKPPAYPVEETTAQQFWKMYNKFMQDPVPFLEVQGMVIDSENRRLIRENNREKNKRNNNKIELFID